MAVADDGIGFDTAGAAAKHGMGLVLMRERVSELGGRLDIHSDASGTTVMASIS